MAVMIEKRRDKKGRVLRNGECQRKDGLYQYDYVDLNGKAKCIYSWKLEPSDPLPQGKRKCKSLREKSVKFKRNIDDGISITPRRSALRISQSLLVSSLR